MCICIYHCLFSAFRPQRKAALDSPVNCSTPSALSHPLPSAARKKRETNKQAEADDQLIIVSKSSGRWWMETLMTVDCLSLSSVSFANALCSVYLRMLARSSLVPPCVGPVAWSTVQTAWKTTSSTHSFTRVFWTELSLWYVCLGISSLSPTRTSCPKHVAFRVAPYLFFSPTKA